MATIDALFNGKRVVRQVIIDDERADFQLKVSSRQWLEWAGGSGIHPHILEYVGIRPDHLWSPPPKTEEPFSTPRSWHMLSNAMKEYGDAPEQDDVFRLAKACLSPHHAVQFNAYIKQVQNRFQLSAIVDGKAAWPDEPENRDVLYFLAQSLRARLIKELPADRKQLSSESGQLALAGKRVFKALARISMEITQMVVGPEEAGGRDDRRLPEWFLIELIRDLPRLAAK